MQIYSYKRVIDQYTTYDLLLPEVGQDEAQCVYLGEHDGLQFWAVPDGLKLPEQPKQIADTLKLVDLKPGQITAMVMKSPLLQLMQERIGKAKITPRYSLADELTLKQFYQWIPKTLETNVNAGRVWAKK